MAFEIVSILSIAVAASAILAGIYLSFAEWEVVDEALEAKSGEVRPSATLPNQHEILELIEETDEFPKVHNSDVSPPPWTPDEVAETLMGPELHSVENTVIFFRFTSKIERKEPKQHRWENGTIGIESGYSKTHRGIA